MALSVGSAPAVATVRLEMKGAGSNNSIIKVFNLDPAIITTGTDLVDMLTAFDALTNAGVVKAAVNGRLITGWAATGATANAQNLVSAIAVLNFSAVNPVNTAKFVRKNFVIPAYKQAIRTDAGGFDNTNTNLTTLTNFLQTYLALLGSNGTWYFGGWTWDENKSGFGTTDMMEIS